VGRTVCEGGEGPERKKETEPVIKSGDLLFQMVNQHEGIDSGVLGMETWKLLAKSVSL